MKKLLPTKTDDEIKKSIFLLPQNIDTKGKEKHLEHLLFMCAKENKNYILKCYENMRECLKINDDSKNLTIPDDHNQAYVFAGVHLTEDEKKLRNNKKIHPYAFFRSDIWNFNCEAINPLLFFLREHVK